MIKIYSSEQEIASRIQASNSIAYQHELSSLSTNIAAKEKVKAGFLNCLDESDKFKIIGGEKDKDLHYIQSVLVTTNWNRNDDVFDVAEVWNARNTPQHKPTNIGHDEHEIVGHMTANWVIDEDGDLIDDNTHIDDLPSLFHVINGSVIYKAWQDPELAERAEKLIAEINDGKKFVSMECIFSGFDYAIISPAKTYKVVARNEETAFLTKHLRAYGGTGLYDGFKIGRLLRNITFTGKGFVDKPANPRSIIFDKEKIFNFSEAKYVESIDFNKSGVYISLEQNSNAQEISMTVDIYKEQVSELKSQVETLTKQLAEATDHLAKADISKLEDTITALETKCDAYKEEVETANTTIAELENKIEKQTEKFDETVKSRDELKEQLDEVQANEKRTNRISTLVDGGLEKEIAEEKVDRYITLSDEQFKDIADELIAVVALKANQNIEENDADDTEDNTDTAESEVSDVQDEEIDETEGNTDVLDNVESEEEASLAADTDSADDKINLLRHAFANLLGQDDDDDSNDEEK